jgi:hypothetical protein
MQILPPTEPLAETSDVGRSDAMTLGNGERENPFLDDDFDDSFTGARIGAVDMSWPEQKPQISDEDRIDREFVGGRLEEINELLDEVEQGDFDAATRIARSLIESRRLFRERAGLAVAG